MQGDNASAHVTTFRTCGGHPRVIVCAIADDVCDRQIARCDPLSAGHAMTTTFDKREEGFEKKFAHDEELRFKANARRNKMLGLWAAGKLGLSGAEAEAYAKEVVVADLEEGAERDVFRKLRKDFDAKGVTQSDQEIRGVMSELMDQAIAQIKAGT